LGKRGLDDLDVINGERLGLDANTTPWAKMTEEKSLEKPKQVVDNIELREKGDEAGALGLLGDGHFETRSKASLMSPPVKGFGRRPITTVQQHRGPSSESLQGRKPRWGNV
jgi:hypothetical protein